MKCVNYKNIWANRLSHFFKRNTPLKEDEETLKKKEEEFVDEIIKTLEINNIKDAFAFIIALEMWDISSVKTGDGYE